MPMNRTGSSPKDTSERISRIVPIVPEKTCPGIDQLEHDQARARARRR